MGLWRMVGDSSIIIPVRTIIFIVIYFFVKQ